MADIARRAGVLRFLPPRGSSCVVLCVLTVIVVFSLCETAVCYTGTGVIRLGDHMQSQLRYRDKLYYRSSMINIPSSFRLMPESFTQVSIFESSPQLCWNEIGIRRGEICETAVRYQFGAESLVAFLFYSVGDIPLFKTNLQNSAHPFGAQHIWIMLRDFSVHDEVQVLQKSYAAYVISNFYHMGFEIPNLSLLMMYEMKRSGILSRAMFAFSMYHAVSADVASPHPVPQSTSWADEEYSGGAAHHEALETLSVEYELWTHMYDLEDTPSHLRYSDLEQCRILSSEQISDLSLPSYNQLSTRGTWSACPSPDPRYISIAMTSDVRQEKSATSMHKIVQVVQPSRIMIPTMSHADVSDASVLKQLIVISGVLIQTIELTDDDEIYLHIQIIHPRDEWSISTIHIVIQLYSTDTRLSGARCTADGYPRVCHFMYIHEFSTLLIEESSSESTIGSSETASQFSFWSNTSEHQYVRNVSVTQVSMTADEYATLIHRRAVLASYPPSGDGVSSMLIRGVWSPHLHVRASLRSVSSPEAPGTGDGQFEVGHPRELIAAAKEQLMSVLSTAKEKIIVAKMEKVHHIKMAPKWSRICTCRNHLLESVRTLINVISTLTIPSSVAQLEGSSHILFTEMTNVETQNFGKLKQLVHSHLKKMLCALNKIDTVTHGMSQDLIGDALQVVSDTPNTLDAVAPTQLMRIDDALERQRVVLDGLAAATSGRRLPVGPSPRVCVLIGCVVGVVLSLVASVLLVQRALRGFVSVGSAIGAGGSVALRGTALLDCSDGFGGVKHFAGRASCADVSDAESVCCGRDDASTSDVEMVHLGRRESL